MSNYNKTAVDPDAQTYVRDFYLAIVRHVIAKVSLTQPELNYNKLADEFGVSRASVHAHKRKILGKGLREK